MGWSIRLVPRDNPHPSVSSRNGLGWSRLVCLAGSLKWLLLWPPPPTSFIVQPLRYGGAAELREYFFSENINITGTVAYACLFVLVMGSFARLRERRYELWLALHIPVAIVFLVYMFIHCSNILTSW